MKKLFVMMVVMLFALAGGWFWWSKTHGDLHMVTTVIENSHGCSIDLACSLLVKDFLGEKVIIYRSLSSRSYCEKSSDAYETAYALQAGDTIEFVAKHMEDNRYVICGEAPYMLKKL